MTGAPLFDPGRTVASRGPSRSSRVGEGVGASTRPPASSAPVRLLGERAARENARHEVRLVAPKLLPGRERRPEGARIVTDADRSSTCILLHAYHRSSRTRWATT